MKRFFEEHTSVAIICIVVSLLLYIIGCINNVNNDGTVAGKGLLKIVGDNLTDTIDTYQKQIVPNDNLLARTSSKITEITKVNDWGWIVGQEHGEGYYYRCIPNQYYTFKVYIDNSKNDKTTCKHFSASLWIMIKTNISNTQIQIRYNLLNKDTQRLQLSHLHMQMLLDVIYVQMVNFQTITEII